MTAPCSAIGQAVLISREGNKLAAYLDSVGVWTIGIGHTAGAGAPAPKAGMKITNAESLALFAKDHLKYAAYVDQALPGVTLSDNQRDALVSICYNIGPKWFTGKTPATFIKHLRAGKFSLVPAAIMKFTTPKEITTRRQAEADQFKTPYSIALPKGRSDDKAPIKAPLAKHAPAAAAITSAATPFRPTNISGRLADIWNTLRGGTPNVTVAYEKPPGFTGSDEVFMVQAKLREKGFTEVGKLDGWIGTDSNAALTACIQNNGEDVNVNKPLFKFDTKTLIYVSKAKARTADALRQVATTRQVQQNAPEVMRPVNTLVSVGMSALFGGGALGGLDSLKGAVDSAKQVADNANTALEQAAPIINAIAPVAVWIGNHPFLLISGVGGLLLIVVGGQAAAIVQMFREKRIN